MFLFFLLPFFLLFPTARANRVLLRFTRRKSRRTSSQIARGILNPRFVGYVAIRACRCYFSPPRFARFILFSLPPYSFFPLFSFHSPVSRILRFKVERIELAPRLVRLRARKYSRKCPSSRGIPARIDPSFCLHFRSTKFPSLRKFRESKQFSKIPDIVSVYELLILAPILPRCQSSNEGQRLQKWRERDQDRATTLFVPIYGVSWGHDSRRGSRLGCFFHPRHLPSRYLFKVNGTGLVSQVCPKTGGFCPDLDGFASDHPFRNFYVSPFQPVT